MQAIAFTGLPRCGKDTAADYLVGKHGFKKLVLSDEIGEILREKGLEDTKMNRSKMGRELRKRFGDSIVAEKAFERASKNGFDKVVFVGPRSPGEIKFFREKIESFLLVCIKAGREKRFERRAATDGKTLEKFLEREKWEKEKFEIEKVIAMADFTIENNSTIDGLHKAIDGLMQKI